jgi:hypothetical protein
LSDVVSDANSCVGDDDVDAVDRVCMVADRCDTDTGATNAEVHATDMTAK